MTISDPQPQTADSQPTAPQPRRRPWVVIVPAAVCVLLAGVVIGLLVNGAQGKPAAAPTRASAEPTPSNTPATDEASAPPVATTYASTDQMRDALATNIVSQCDAYQVHSTASVVPGALQVADCKDTMVLTIYDNAQDAQGGVSFSCLPPAYMVLGPNWTANCSSSLEATAVAMAIGGRIIPC